MTPADVQVQRALGLRDIPCLDIRQQCTGVNYGLSIADAYVRTGAFKHILLIGSEVHSTGLDISTAGRDVTVLFGDDARPWSSAVRPTVVAAYDCHGCRTAPGAHCR